MARGKPLRVLPMQIQVGDRFIDELGAWEITTRPKAGAGGKLVHARARRPDDLLSPPRDVAWAAHQRIEVVRTLEGLAATSAPKRAPRKGGT